MFLAGSYINIGCEALHLGQIALIGMEDQNYKQWERMLDKIRSNQVSCEYAYIRFSSRVKSGRNDERYLDTIT